MVLFAFMEFPEYMLTHSRSTYKICSLKKIHVKEEASVTKGITYEFPRTGFFQNSFCLLHCLLRSLFHAVGAPLSLYKCSSCVSDLSVLVLRSTLLKKFILCVYMIIEVLQCMFLVGNLENREI